MKALIRFSDTLHFRDHSSSYVQCWCRDIQTGKEFWLGFSKSCALFNRICNVTYRGEFTAYVQYNENTRNRVKLVSEKETKQFVEKHPEYFI